MKQKKYALIFERIGHRRRCFVAYATETSSCSFTLYSYLIIVQFNSVIQQCKFYGEKEVWKECHREHPLQSSCRFFLLKSCSDEYQFYFLSDQLLGDTSMSCWHERGQTYQAKVGFNGAKTDTEKENRLKESSDTC
jgi:hypothetical protein